MKTVQPGIHFEEVQIILRGVDERGRKKVYRLNHKLTPLMGVSMDATRPVKKKGKRIIPSEYVFHTMRFVTGG